MPTTYKTTSGSALDNLALERDFDASSWDAFRHWKEQFGERFGAGTRAPAIPRSQRQYDGENHFEFCEVYV